MKAHSVVINLLWFTALAQAGQRLPAATWESQSGQRKPTAPISINSAVTTAWIPPISNKSPILNPFPTQSCPHSTCSMSGGPGPGNGSISRSKPPRRVVITPASCTLPTTTLEFRFPSMMIPPHCNQSDKRFGWKHQPRHHGLPVRNAQVPCSPNKTALPPVTTP